MKKIGRVVYLLLALLTLSLVACIKDESFENTSQGNFEALWTIIDENYCFFDYKAEEYGLDWDNVYNRYKTYVLPGIGERSLFELLCRMLAELRDGHVNLISPYDLGRYWAWFENYPQNFSSNIQQNYLGNDYWIIGSFKCKILEDNIGYIYYSSFLNPIIDSSLDEIFSKMALCNGLILDLRDNTGGNLNNTYKLASRFTNEKIVVGYYSHKTGIGHSDFSPFEIRYIEPYMQGLRWQKPVTILTNRSCFSATNTFVSDMKQLSNITVIGDRTGGGGGMPASSELPNGWSVRYSSSPIYDVDSCHIEFGIDPDIKVDMLVVDMERGEDTIIERARDFLNGN